MKKVIIPSSSKPFVVDINGKKYTYQAGTEQEVPDEVAVIIEAYYEHHNDKPEVTDPPFSGGASSWNDLTDKPFGESENAVLLPPTQFAFDSTFGLFAVVGYIDFVLGKTYTVKWNGVDYKTTAVAGTFNGENLVMLGNPAALGGTNNNLPFAVACLMGSIGAIPFDGSTAVNVGISGYALTKIEEKFLPDVSTTLCVTFTKIGNNEYTTDTTADEIKKAFNAGQVIFARSKLSDATGEWYIFPMVHFFNNGQYVVAHFSVIEPSKVFGCTITEKRFACTWNYPELGDIFCEYTIKDSGEVT